MMIYLVKIVILIFGSVVLQISLIAKISIFGSSPDLPLAFVLALALFRGSFHGEIAGFVTGILSDAFSGGLLGLQAISKLISGFCAGLLRGRLYSDNVITQFLAGFVGTILNKLVEVVYLVIFFNRQYLNYKISGLIIVAAINSFMVIMVYWLLKRIIRAQK
ncbi:rod shape-determining protein MreD [Candidatus Poribacteria bacterium]|nr:rod shape-determining protein MreD [Candidatus Poribacteria bacterium]